MDVTTIDFDGYIDVRHAELGVSLGEVHRLSGTEYSALGKMFDTVEDAVEHIRDSFVGRVRSGALIMDQVKPDWYKMVDTEKLNMNYVDMCIIGQVFGKGSSDPLEQNLNYGEALDALPISAVDGGFDDSYNAFGVLKALWVLEIEKRRSE